MTPRLVLATANPAKGAELRRLLAGLPYEIQGLTEYPGVELPAEQNASYAENARVKARVTAAATGAVALGDDSGLEVDALGGRPGLATARYGGPGLTDAARIARLLGEMAGAASRTARFRCVLALVAPGGEETTVEGVLTEAPRGTDGFGYDPVFLVPALRRTLAELPPGEKDAVSHRGRAAARAREILARWATSASTTT